MRRLSDVMLLASALAFASCSESFDPTVAGPRPYAVFAPLHAGTDTQYIRLSATSDPADSSPAIMPFQDATVTVAGPGGGVVAYHPVAAVGEPGTPENGVLEYRAAGFRPVRGGSYSLQVQTTAGTATAAMVMPNSAGTSILLREPSILSRPHSYPLEAPIVVNIHLANESLGFLVRLVLDYEVDLSGTWEVKSWEVPLGYKTVATVDDPGPIFPKLTRRRNAVSTTGGTPPPETVVFSNRVYEESISLIHARHISKDLRMRRVRLILLQADRHLFNYYALANSFDDPLSIRLDQPDYSNIHGALGFFGGLTSDTLLQAIPNDLKPR